jgi:D-beta-D-heptose 7-phosphate kinase / D-beta-D-heptose 1-phosphate adenosyltransferase
MSDWSHHRLDALRGKRVLVLGDVMLDTFVYGQCARLSPEAPVPVLRIEREQAMLGGAGNVARNVAALGGEAVLVGIVGEDAPGRALRERIAAEPAIHAELIADGRPTTAKVRFVAAGQQLLRVDAERIEAADPDPLAAAFERHLAAADAVVLSDYAKGVLSPPLLARVLGAARAAGKPVVADPKSPDVARYDGVTVLTPNAGEATGATGRACGEDADVDAAAALLLQRMPATAAVLVTRGARGMSLARRGAATRHLPALAREVFDVSGAGDSVVATLAMGLAAGLALADAAELANVAGGVAVSKPGTAAVTRDDLLAELQLRRLVATGDKVVARDEAARIVAGWRAAGARIGFTNGCFDLIHPGHVAQLTQARSRCDRLVVGLNDDASVRRLKGSTRPIQDEAARAAVLAALVPVDLVVPFAEDTPVSLIAALRPDVLVKGKDYAVEAIAGADLVLGWGGEVFLADLVPGQSTTAIAARLGGG